MTISGRDTPPSVQDGRFGYEPQSIDIMSNELDDDGDVKQLDESTAQRLARNAYEASTDWINASRRQDWSNSLRAFQSQHPMGSKYLSNDWKYRSALYRPKTRAMVRKGEAQTASAFFSNEEVVSIDAVDDDDPMQQASAEFTKYVLQYRLTKSIPWFLTVIGARQDCDVMGCAVIKTTWQFEERKTGNKVNTPVLDDNGMPQDQFSDETEIVHDKPRMDLIPMENFRFDAGADWRNPVESSPYVIELIPMYMQDVKAKMDSGEWFDLSTSALHASSSIDDDVTRRVREQGRLPGKSQDSWKPKDYTIVWVHENIIKWEGQDWHYYCLHGTCQLLTDPVPLKEKYFHGIRPYVCGMIVPETHKTYPSSKAELVSNLQWGANDDWNLRFDNVKLALNPRQIIKTGSGIEVSDVQRMMPGKVIQTQNPETDIKWDRPPDVTQSAYAEQDRINLDFDELVGDFSNSSVQATQIQEQSATGMHLMSGQAAGMVEYELKVFVETLVEPVLRQLIKLEQAYETDEVVLTLAAKKANLIQKYGIDTVTDELLNQELTLRVNVGIGATNPATRLKNFTMAGDILGKFFGPALAQGANFQEISKEIFAYLGYKDGVRFFSPSFDPRVASLTQQLQEAQKKAGAGKDGFNPQQHAAELQGKAQLQNQQQQGRLQEIQTQAANDQKIAQTDYQKTQMQEQMENQRTFMQMKQESAQQVQGQQHEAIEGNAQRHHDWLSMQAGQRADELTESRRAVQKQDERLAGGGRSLPFRG